MSTLAEIRSAIDVLPLSEQKELLLRLQDRLWAMPAEPSGERTAGLHEGMA